MGFRTRGFCTSRRRWIVSLVAGCALLAAACGGDDTADAPSATSVASSTDGSSTAATGSTAATDSAADRFPDVLSAEATYDDAAASWSFAVTLSSPYDTPERYADGWRVMDADGAVYGVHTLAHDHANEQPFTRRQSGVEIPDTVDEVIIEGRDQRNGFGGATVTVSLHTG